MIKLERKYILILIVSTVLTVYFSLNIINQKSINKELIQKRLDANDKIKASRSIDYREASKLASDIEKQVFVGSNITKISNYIESIIINNDCNCEDMRLMIINSNKKTKKSSDNEVIKKDNIKISLKVSGSIDQLALMVEDLLSNSKKFKVLSMEKKVKDDINSLDIDILAFSYTPKSLELMKKYDMFNNYIYQNSINISHSSDYELEEELNDAIEENTNGLENSDEEHKDLEINSNDQTNAQANNQTNNKFESKNAQSNYELEVEDTGYDGVNASLEYVTELALETETKKYEYPENDSFFYNILDTRTIAIVDYIELDTDYSFRITTDYIPID